MLARLALLFILVPLAELALLIQVGRWTGLWTTVALVFLTGIVGAGLARAEGLRTLWAFQKGLAQGTIPGQAIQDGLAILVGGALLLTPGFLTDVVGFGLLLPPTRRFLQGLARRRLRRMMEDGSIRVMTGSDLFRGGRGFGEAGDDRSTRPGRGTAREPGPPGESEPPELDPENEIVG